MNQLHEEFAEQAWNDQGLIDGLQKMIDDTSNEQRTK